MKNFVARMLRKSAQAILKKYKPKVIAITGSVGKTSAKEAIFAVVSAQFTARTNIKNYNNEFGLPLTIIGAVSPKGNPLGWLAVFWRAMRMLVGKREDYPQVLVLELGIDRPGDMDYLMEIIRPDIAVMTTIGISHLQYFHSEEQIFAEKKKIFKNFGARDIAILNVDDRRIVSLLPELSQGKGSETVTYGASGTANVRIINYHTDLAHNKAGAGHNGKQIGTTAQFNVQNRDMEIFWPDVLGAAHVYAAAAAIATGLAMRIKRDDIFAALKNYNSQPGRMRVIKGPRNSIIIDDTYNSAPFSSAAALKELGDFPAPRKIAVLGDMLELGALSHISHQDVAEEIQKYAIDYFVAVGPEMEAAVKELKRLHFDQDRIFHFDKSTDAIAKVNELITANSAVLIKGSQGIRMEKIVRALMANPEQAGKLLCRQDPDWLVK